MKKTLQRWIYLYPPNWFLTVFGTISWKDANRVYLIDQTYELFSLSLLLREASLNYENGSKEKYFYNHDEEVYHDLAYAYKEIIEFGIGGFKSPNGIFLNETKMDRLFEYLG